MHAECAAELATEIAGVLERLSREERLLVEDHFKGGSSLAAIARRLGISPHRVGRVASRLRVNLAETLQSFRPGDVADFKPADLKPTRRMTTALRR